MNQNERRLAKRIGTNPPSPMRMGTASGYNAAASPRTVTVTMGSAALLGVPLLDHVHGPIPDGTGVWVMTMPGGRMVVVGRVGVDDLSIAGSISAQDAFFSQPAGMAGTEPQITLEPRPENSQTGGSIQLNGAGANADFSLANINGHFAVGDIGTLSSFRAIPLGVMGKAVGTSDDSGIGTAETDVEDMEVVFTGVPGRLYLAVVNWRVSQQTSSGVAQSFIRCSGGSSVVKRVATSLAANESTGHTVVLPFTATGSTTVKGRAATSASTMTVLGGSSYQRDLLVLDIGIN